MNFRPFTVRGRAAPTPRSLGLVFLGLLLLLAGSTSAVRARAVPAAPEPPTEYPEDSLAPAAGVTAWYRLTGEAFCPVDSDDAYSYGGDNGCRQFPTVTASAPVILPHGSTITYVRMYYHNTNASSQWAGWLKLRSYNGAGGYEDYVTISARPGSTTGIGYFSDGASLSLKLEDADHAYVLESTTLGSDQALCGVRLVYNVPYYPAFLPSMHR